MSHPLPIAQPLLSWFDRHRRDLPWRVPGGAPEGAAVDPYRVLVSEAMLQQTQVATVVPYFHRFLEAFPTVEALARAEEQQVLRLWQGLGYYSRARNLHRTAKVIVERFAGRVPSRVEDLFTLPGIGRYTAGAVASIAYGTHAPILDGNVTRVLCRLDAIDADPRDRATQSLLWSRAAEILPDRRVGDFNQALMELGATVCTPKTPSCLLCPVRAFCRAQAMGIQDRIPPARVGRQTPIERRWVACVRNASGEYLVEQRPAAGRWAGMWQFATIIALSGKPTPKRVSERLGVPVGRLAPLIQVKHALTHRRYEFDAFTSVVNGPANVTPPRRWMTLERMTELPFSKPQLAIREALLRSLHQKEGT